jgi:hypothetical protein
MCVTAIEIALIAKGESEFITTQLIIVGLLVLIQIYYNLLKGLMRK